MVAGCAVVHLRDACAADVDCALREDDSFWIGNLMAHNFCRRCGSHAGSSGSGRIADPNRCWWQFWKVILCPDCGGDGYAKPPGYPDRDAMAQHGFRLTDPD